MALDPAAYPNLQPRKPTASADYGMVAAQRIVKNVLFSVDSTLERHYFRQVLVGQLTGLPKIYAGMGDQHINALAEINGAYGSNLTRFGLAALPTNASYPADLEVDTYVDKDYTEIFKKYVNRLGVTYGIAPQLLMSAWVTLMTAEIAKNGLDTIRTKTTMGIVYTLKEVVPYLPRLVGANSYIIPSVMYGTTLSNFPQSNQKRSSTKRKRKSKRRYSKRY